MILLSTGSSIGGGFFQLLGVLLIFVFVLVITYLVTKWIAGYQKGQAIHKNLQVVETLKLTPNKYVQIVEAGTKYLVIAIGKDEVTLLTTLEKDELKVLPEELQNTDGRKVQESFQEILDKLKEHLPNKQAKS